MSILHDAPGAHDPNDVAWKRHYEAQRVVGTYRGDDRLQAPERAILALLSEDLPRASLLDVGVGGGRTALHLAGVCKSYLGVEYSDAMVQACHERFAGAPWYTPERFRQADARALPFDNALFDIVFFSFNGLDHVPTVERPAALAQCMRVLRPGGWFIYSGHNLGWYDGQGLLPRSRGWRDWVDQYLFLQAMRRMNPAPKRTRAVDAVDMHDPPEGLLLHYARPIAHLRELQAAGFGGVRAFDGSGRELTVAGRLNVTRDAWVYYLARQMEADSIA